MAKITPDKAITKLLALASALDLQLDNDLVDIADLMRDMDNLAKTVGELTYLDIDRKNNECIVSYDIMQKVFNALQRLEVGK